MIRYVSRRGMHCPAVYCDHCRDQLTDHGNVVWAVRLGTDRTRDAEPTTLHKGACTRAYESALRADGWHPLSDELDTFLAQLTHNITAPLPAA